MRACCIALLPPPAPCSTSPGPDCLMWWAALAATALASPPCLPLLFGPLLHTCRLPLHDAMVTHRPLLPCACVPDIRRAESLPCQPRPVLRGSDGAHAGAAGAAATPCSGTPAANRYSHWQRVLMSLVALVWCTARNGWERFRVVLQPVLWCVMLLPCSS